MNTENPFGEVIYSYTRAQAIADGVLVDLTQVPSIKQHWNHPFACTAAVWGIIERALQRPGQDLAGICHDIGTISKSALAKPAAVDQLAFKVLIAGRLHAFKLHVGPGDDGEAVLTLMLPNED